MRTILFIVGVVLIVLIALYIKHRPENKEIVFEGQQIFTRWDTILKGKWIIWEIASNKDEYWKDSTVIEFFGDHEFKAHATEEYFLNSYGDFYSEVIVGGGFNGKWKADNDSSFTVYSKDCHFTTSKGSGGPYAHRIRLLTCNKLFSVEYGDIAELNFVSEIETISDSVILIRGRSYKLNVQIASSFTRIK